MPKIFISSTYTDLKEYHEKAISVCGHLGIEPISMEYMNAMDADAVDGSNGKLSQADLMVGIYANRYGTIPDGSDYSITEQEYTFAKENCIPRICFLVDEDFSWSPALIDFNNYPKLQNFKTRIMKERIVSFFTSVEDFGEKLTQALAEWKEQFTESSALEKLSSRDVVVNGDVINSTIISGNGNTGAQDHSNVLGRNALVALGDPRFREDFYYLPNDEVLGFVKIPAGKFLMGSDPKINSSAREIEQPQHELFLPTYYMAKYPVTVGQWQKYVETSGHRPKDKRSLVGIRNHPVVNVTWYETSFYCEWLNKELRISDQTPQQIKKLLENGWQIGLPSEAEWEKAARGVDGRIYPYGNEYDPQKGNTIETDIGTTSSVGFFVNGESPYECLDMSGNVWEWQPNLRAKYSDFRALRGGSWDNDRNDARCDYCGGYPQGFGAENIGFRICLLKQAQGS